MTPQQQIALDAIKAAAQSVLSNEAIVRQSLADAPPSDDEPPVMVGALQASEVTQTGYRLTWAAGSDNVGVVGYQLTLDAGQTWTDLGNVLTTVVSGRTPGATDSPAVRNQDAAGYFSAPITTQVTLASPPASGPTYGGLPVTLVKADQFSPPATPFAVQLSLHGSGSLVLGVPPNGHGAGDEFACNGDARFDMLDGTLIRWATRTDQLVPGQVLITPLDSVPAGDRYFETYHMGYLQGGQLRLYTERRYDAMLDWFDAYYPHASRTKRTAVGGSMGAWGLMTYVLRRPQRFAALFASRPRWHRGYPIYAGTGGDIHLPGRPPEQITRGFGQSNAPMTDTGISSWQHLNSIAYVANPANKIPFVLWCMGRRDGYAPWEDHMAAVAALRATNRGFAFSWNDGDHSTGNNMAPITASYTADMFEIGVGYPILSGSSRDQDPAVDLVGGINLGFKWRNVVETAGSWSCEIANILGDTTVTVEPHSDVYAGPATPQTITIPAGQWVTVAFS